MDQIAYPILYRCARMSARISEATCSINQQNTLDNRCLGCMGLDKEEEAHDMLTICKADGCSKGRFLGGYCYLHAKEFIPDKLNENQERARNAKKTAPKVPKREDAAKRPAPLDMTRNEIGGMLTIISPDPPAGNPLDRLLAPPGLAVEIPPELARRMADAGITADNVVELTTMLVNGELRRV